MGFREQFTDFCSRLYIDSKEFGLIPLRLNGAQLHVIVKIAMALERGVHFFVLLKCRQIGMTTLILALVLYWLFKYSGMQGAVVIDTDTNHDYFRSILVDYMEKLPKTHKIPVKIHNRNQLILSNRSRASYLVAGTRIKGNLGRGKALNFCHMTECSSYADQQGLLALLNAFAETHPHRLYIAESTALGFNLFFDMWEEAKKAKSQEAIFATWWMNEYYSIPKTDIRFKVYWDGAYTSDEKDWIKEVKLLYKHEITPEQLAWYRWKLWEVNEGDLNIHMQEFPPTPEYAFILTGSKYFNTGKITDAYKANLTLPYDAYRYSFGANFLDTRLHPTSGNNTELKIWEYPKPDGIYVIGGDPAYGSSDNADRFDLCVYRCFADKLVQVAEYNTANCEPKHFAWIIAHLCGAYRGNIPGFNDCRMVLEMDGGGVAVFTELEHLRQSAHQIAERQAMEKQDDSFRNVALHYSYFLSHRVDSTRFQYSYGWKSNESAKRGMLDAFKSEFQLGNIILRSTELLDEMRYVSNEGRGISAEGKKKDDRVIGAGLGCWGWIQQIRPLLYSRQLYWKDRRDEDNPDKPTDNPVINMTNAFLRDRKIQVQIR